MSSMRIAPSSLHRLRRRLAPLGPAEGAAILQEAGFATGEALATAWRNRVAERTGLEDPALLDTRWFGPLLDELCVTLGYGSLAVTSLGDSVMLLESGDWAEAEPGQAGSPGCHFSCGCLAAFLTEQAGAPLGVLEVECRTAGDAACRFLAAGEATLAQVIDLQVAGGDWRDAMPGADVPPPVS